MIEVILEAECPNETVAISAARHPALSAHRARRGI